MKKYPDVTQVLKQKAARRRQLAELSFEEKIAIVNKWRRLSKQIQENQASLPSTKVLQSKGVKVS